MEIDSLADVRSNSDAPKKRRISSTDKALEETAMEHNEWLSNIPINPFSCQSDDHTKNYYKRIPICVKCAGIHWTSNCPIRKEKITDVKCHNCQGNHPASYKGCTVRKQLQHKLFPKLRNKSVTGNSNTVNQTVTTITNINNNIPAKTYQNTEPKKKTYVQIARPRGGEVVVSPSENQNFIPDMLEIKKLLLALAKNTEVITNMLLQQTQLLTQQSQQISKMIELLLHMVNTLENNCYYNKPNY